MSRLDVRVERRLGQLTVLSLSGRCTAPMAATLREALAVQLDKEPRGLLLNGAELEEIEGRCLHEILLADRQLRARQGALAIYALPDLLLRSLDAADLLEDVDVHTTFAEARKAVEARTRKARQAAVASQITTSQLTASQFTAEVEAQGLSLRRTMRHREGRRLAALVDRILRGS